MNISALLDKLKEFDDDVDIEQRTLPDGTRQYIISAKLPFPIVGKKPAWYVLTLKPGHDEIDKRELEAMLRHLWMFQIGIDDDDEE